MLTISVCVGSACQIKGSYDVINRIQSLIKEYEIEDKVKLKGAFCLGRCTPEVSVSIEEENKIYSVSTDNVDSFFKEHVLGGIN